ncbi:RNA polymerase, sigma-24 subunit, ECF subfamily [Pedosphaera parvula Ellin514]|uniref:RNA polymerase, sigma-24 subunit, ECF subfamily n=1 Tax=Pedosphaera parvula (strain Ellin514) TaxID=320771 RepID=B9XHZ3_PEDPL|nr:RNA polymerase, sigma-24 subunit, ECF subfamily [Pedosphaera parvula Ellin514]
MLKESSKVESAPDERTDVARLTSDMAANDEAAYRKFYELYFNRLLRYLLVLSSGNEEAAREALQTTMLRVVRHVRRFDPEEVFWSWLTVLARSSVVDAERKRKRYFGLLERFFYSKSSNPPGIDETESGLIELLEKSLEKLSYEDRELMERKYGEGESVKSIASGIGATEKAVESRLGRIRRQLKEVILHHLKHEK